MFKLLLQLSRPKQWIKNAALFAVPVLTFELWRDDLQSYYNLGAILLAMILASSAVYAFNDASDYKMDSRHPLKQYRPIASGALSIKAAYLFGFISALISLTLSLYATGVFGFFILFSYLILNIAYSFKLKNAPFIEAFIVAYGYPARVILSVLATHSPITLVFMIITICLALAIVFAKRISQKNSTHGVHRKVLNYYSNEFLTKAISISLSLGWVTLIYWILSKVVTITEIGYNLVAAVATITIVSSVPFFTYIYKEAVIGNLEHPEKIIKNPMLIVSMLFFAPSFITLLEWAV